MSEPIRDWLAYVKQWAQLIGAEESADLMAESRTAGEAGPVVLLFSPHPDDECLTGALPLRLQQECAARVINLAVTLGHAHQQQRRRGEVEAACAMLGFELVIPNEGNAFLDVSPEVRRSNPQRWEGWCAEFAAILAKYRPHAVFAPHPDDFHPAHIAVHLLVQEALQRYLAQASGPVAFFETEYWHAMSAPNLLVGVRAKTEAAILEATACHAGEVARNPYHLRHPARMIDNVRRGSEVVMGRGGPGRTFAFGELYRGQWLYPDGHSERMSPRVLEPADRIAMKWLRPEA